MEINLKVSFGKLSKELPKYQKMSIFKSTQNYLTLLYSGLIMIFLILFVVIVYSLLYVGTLKVQEYNVEKIAEKKKDMLENYIAKQTTPKKLNEIQLHILTKKEADQFFYYVLNSKKELIIADEVNIELRPKILGLLEKWNPKKVDTHQEKITINYSQIKLSQNNKNVVLTPAQKSREVNLMIAGHPIFYKNQFKGMLYIGKDISFAYQLFYWLRIILLILIIVFLAIVLYVSHIMAKKSIIPIKSAFEKQQQFVADASHELRTPLSVMLSSIDAIEMTVDTKKNKFTEKLITNMRSEVKHMTRLVSDLLTIARSDSANLKQTFKTFNVLPLVEQVVHSIELIAKEKNIHIHLDTTESITIQGDPKKLTQLLYILLDNGIKYTPPNGHIYISLLIDSYKNNPTMFIKVRDTGIGIRPEDCNYIFDRFYRADKSRSRKTGGHGLGLAIAKLIVEAHSGTIEVSSELNQGSTFIIRIPLSKGV